MFKFQRDNVKVHISSVDFHYYINGPISDPDDYIDMIDALYTGKPNETIIIHLNTPGGRLDIAMQIINAIKVTEAEVITLADGEVASAGSLILFAASNIAVQPYSYVMIHDGSEGAGGKLNENLKQAQFSAKMLTKLYKDIYVPFFTEAEVDAVLDGKDMWLTSDEVNERVKQVATPKEEDECLPAVE